METKKSPGLMAKVRRKRWTKDDTEEGVKILVSMESKSF